MLRTGFSFFVSAHWCGVVGQAQAQITAAVECAQGLFILQSAATEFLIEEFRHLLECSSPPQAQARITAAVEMVTEIGCDTTPTPQPKVGKAAQQSVCMHLNGMCSKYHRTC